MKTRNEARFFALLSGTLLALSVPAWSALAHPGHKGSERLLKLDLGADPPRFSYGLILAADAAALARKQADRDGNENVSELESGGSLEALTRDFVSKLTVCRGPSVAESKCYVATPEQVLSASAEGWGNGQGTLAFSWARSVELRGSYVWGDYCSSSLRTLREVTPGNWQSAPLLQLPGAGLTSFGEDVNGELYLTFNNTVYKLDSNTPAVPALSLRALWAGLLCFAAALAYASRRRAVR